jgi:DNA-directed RNA polymerase subunit RPC12/RpoP
MSTQEMPSSGAPPRSAKPGTSGGNPVCPRCQRRMTVKQVSSVLFATDVDDVVYGCDKCGTEDKRTVRRK